jgi:hypothetical protein
VGRAGEVGRLAAALALLAGLACAGVGAQTPAAATDAKAASPVLLGPEIPVTLAEGLRVVAVPARIEGSTGDPERDRQLR